MRVLFAGVLLLVLLGVSEAHSTLVHISVGKYLGQGAVDFGETVALLVKQKASLLTSSFLKIQGSSSASDVCRAFPGAVSSVHRLFAPQSLMQLTGMFDNGNSWMCVTGVVLLALQGILLCAVVYLMVKFHWALTHYCSNSSGMSQCPHMLLRWSQAQWRMLATIFFGVANAATAAYCMENVS